MALVAQLVMSLCSVPSASAADVMIPILVSYTIAEWAENGAASYLHAKAPTQSNCEKGVFKVIAEGFCWLCLEPGSGTILL